VFPLARFCQGGGQGSPSVSNKYVPRLRRTWSVAERLTVRLPLHHDEAMRAAQLKKAWADEALYVRPTQE